MPKKWTLSDVVATAAATEALVKRDLMGIQFRFGGTPEVHIMSYQMVDLLRETGVEPNVQRNGDRSDYWAARVVYGGVEFFALFGPHELPQIGYELSTNMAPTRPVKIA